MKHLEPVVKKKSSYSILFLRDDSGVVRFRLKPFWIKFLGVLVFVFFGTSGAAGYAAHYYWKKYQILQIERTELAAKLGENRRQLGRFAGVETIKESTLPRSTMTGVASIAASSEGTNGNTSTQQSEENRQTPSAPGTPPAADAQASASSASSQTPVAAQQAPAQPAVQPEPAGQSDAANPSEEAPKSEDKEHPGFIAEVQIRSAGNRTFRLAFDLSNRDSQLTLNGRVLIAVATADGKRYDVTQVNRDHLRFIINRYKRVNTSFVLPDELETDEVNRLFLTITAEDQPPVTYAFPIPSSS